MPRPTYQPTINGLVDALVAWLQPVLAELKLEPAEGGDLRSPVRVAGWLPPKRTADEPRPPFVLVRARRGTDGEDDSRLTALLLVETFSEDAAGWRDVGNVVQRLRNALTADQVVGPFRLELPLDWEIFDEQPQPQWGAVLTTTWSAPRSEWIEPTE